jgi:serine/threonine protein kinase
MDDGPKSPNPAAALTFPPLAADQWVFNRFWLERELGRGPGSVVWLAEDRRRQIWVALKFLSLELARDAAALEAVRRETLLSRRIAHPRIARIFAFEQNESMAAIAVEFVEGRTLSQLREQRAEECFEAADLERWIGQLCEALQYAHTGPRVVHGDLKPANLLIDADGNLKVTDFGIAQVLPNAASRATPAPLAAASLHYRSPQRALGALPCKADDIYSVGAVIYEMITSQPPFYRGDVAAQIQSAVVPSLKVRREELQIQGAPIPPAWEEAVAGCLAKNPEDRPASAEVLANLLGMAPRSEGSPRSPRVRSRALLLVAALLFAGPLFWNYHHSRRSPPRLPSVAVRAEPSPTPLPLAAPPPVALPNAPEPSPLTLTPLTLAPPKTGSIFVNSLPPGAIVSLDGVRTGISPMKVENIPLRSGLLALEKDGYERQELMINPAPGGFQQPPLIELIRKPSELPRATPPPIELPRSMPAPAAPPPATPSPTPETQRAPTANAGTPEALVETYVEALMNADPAPYLQLCAPRVDFFDEGVQNHERIRRERKKLAERWPIYRVENVRDISVEDTADAEKKRVAFTYDWEVSNPAKKLDRSGTAHDILDLHKTGGRWLITKMRQERVGR